jgi:class 3 adenylate cyclase
VDASYNSQRYHQRQAERVETLRAKIAEREMVANDGRVMPEDGDLPIGVGRRLNAAIMFIDICDFSDRPATTLHEQERMLRVLSFFFTELIKIIEDYGGTVEKNTGDGLMAYFNSDNASSHNEAQRACAAALTIFYTATNLLNPVIAHSNITPLDFRICIDHGAITVAHVGAARRFRSFVAIGTNANIACKLLKIAKANQIVVGENVKLRLPLRWQQFCTPLPDNTGFQYIDTKRPYPAYHFDAFWNGLRDDR